MSLNTPSTVNFLQENPEGNIESALKEVKKLEEQNDLILDNISKLESVLQIMKYCTSVSRRKIKNKIDNLQIQYDENDNKQGELYNGPIDTFKKEITNKSKDQLQPFVISIPEEIEALGKIQEGTSINDILETIRKVRDLADIWKKNQDIQNDLYEEIEDAGDMYAKYLISSKTPLAQIEKYKIYINQANKLYDENNTISHEINRTISTVRDVIHLETSTIKTLIKDMNYYKQPFDKIIRCYITQKYIIPHLNELNLKDSEAYKIQRKISEQWINDQYNDQVTISFNNKEYVLIENKDTEPQRKETEKSRKQALQKELGGDYKMFEKIDSSMLTSLGIDEDTAKKAIIDYLKGKNTKEIKKDEPLHITFKQQQEIPVKEYPIDQCVNPNECKIYENSHNKKDFHLYYMTSENNITEKKESSTIHLIFTFNNSGGKVNITHAAAIPEGCKGTYTSLHKYNSKNPLEEFEKNGMVIMVDKLDGFTPYNPEENSKN